MGRTIAEGPYEWDSAKDRANQRKHNVSFVEAASVLLHRDVKIIENPTAEGRFVAIGYSRRGRILTVVHEARGERERVISAWRSTRAERQRYLTPEAEEG